MAKEHDIREILCGPAASPKETDSVTFLAVVRPGKTGQTFSMALHDNRQWVDMNVADVADAREHGIVEIDGTQCKLVALTVPRQKGEGVWFDLFKDAVSSLANAAAMTSTGCDCSQGAAPGPVFFQNRRPIKVRGVDANCYSCKLINGEWRCAWICPGEEPR